MRNTWLWRTFGVALLGAAVAFAGLASCRSSPDRPPAATPSAVPQAASPALSSVPSAAERERAYADLVDRVTNVAFAPDSPAYDVRNVDAFLDEVVAALHAGRPVPAERIKAAAAGFRPAASGVKGYSRAEVDAFIGELTDRMAQLP
ncbi:hypothetical protein Val02_54280 [Virgisporangium aliadipatigenens]|uniref:DivIVA domain-containing protein n=1 Tax=Virgisporangium aliadipatigenens TaxID=741659 RepID=A0A8J3YQ62_9ACTN|nr:hypothetical protein [Virgisporangium aliadipatigenens]GIJ48542.1 hypothetical protein Val02_54280 [Virgisporangium aliadipatigenens]